MGLLLIMCCLPENLRKLRLVAPASDSPTCTPAATLSLVLPPTRAASALLSVTVYIPSDHGRDVFLRTAHQLTAVDADSSL